MVILFQIKICGLSTLYNLKLEREDKGIKKEWKQFGGKTTQMEILKIF